MSSIRAFVAVNVPVALVEEVRAVQETLRERARDARMKVVWVPPPNMHVTLKFLGQLPEETVWSVRDLLSQRLAGWAPVALTVRGTGVFPDLDRPRVIWVGVHSDGDGDPLTELAAEVDRALETLGFQPETRPFHAHITLGRVKQGSSQDLLAELEEISFKHSECTVHEVVLYRSVLERKGAEYTPLARFPLAAGRAGEGPRAITEEKEHGR